MKRLRQLAAVRAELAEAAAWYEDRRFGLGDDFYDAYERALGAIAEAPSRWPRVANIVAEVRRVQLHEFSIQAKGAAGVATFPHRYRAFRSTAAKSAAKLAAPRRAVAFAATGEQPEQRRQRG